MHVRDQLPVCHRETPLVRETLVASIRVGTFLVIRAIVKTRVLRGKKVFIIRSRLRDSKISPYIQKSPRAIFHLEIIPNLKRVTFIIAIQRGIP